MRGYPKPLPVIPPQLPAQQPVIQPSARLTWSRQIIDQAREQSLTPGLSTGIPNVRSMAAARARAGESYTTPVPIPKIDPVPKIDPLPVPPLPAPAPALRRQEIVASDEPAFQPIEPAPSLISGVRNAFQSLLQLISRAIRLSD
jgi:hypothetical protein